MSMKYMMINWIILTLGSKSLFTSALHHPFQINVNITKAANMLTSNGDR